MYVSSSLKARGKKEYSFDISGKQNVYQKIKPLSLTVNLKKIPINIKPFQIKANSSC
jgi:hypothetical protein